MYLHLDPHFNPFPEGKVIEFTSLTFPGGEPHIKISGDLLEVQTVTITHRIRSFNDLGLLLIAVDALRRMGVMSISAFIPYFPAARQDRVMVPGEALSAKVYAELINNLRLDKVTVFDPHSEVTPALLNDGKVVSNHRFIEKVLANIQEEVFLVAPDGGALKKIYKVSEHLGGIPVVECSKKRNVTNGQLEGFKVYQEDLQGKSCLIVDDICDGGGTFVGLAKELEKKNAGKIHLAVSHGIFSKGLEELGGIFEMIYTTDTFKDVEDPKVVQIKLQDLI